MSHQQAKEDTRMQLIPPTAIVQFESGMALMVDERMKWEKVDDAG